MGTNRIDESSKIVRLHLPASVLLHHRIARLVIQAEFVLHVDDERVDLGRIGDADGVLEATSVRAEAKDVQSAGGKCAPDQGVEDRRSWMGADQNPPPHRSWVGRAARA